MKSCSGWPRRASCTIQRCSTAQVRRMLADPKSKALVENFAGQWLRLRNVADWKPDPDKFKDVDEALRNAFERETELFFENIVGRRPQRAGIHRRRLHLPQRTAGEVLRNSGREGQLLPARGADQGPERGGILTQASVLMVTSYPTRTSPVLRGKWILESILNAPPPPPPPNVPALDESAPALPPRACARRLRSIAPTWPARPAIRAWIRWAFRSRISTRSASTAPRKATRRSMRRATCRTAL